MPTIQDASKVLKDILAQKECPSYLLITSPDKIRLERALHSLFKKFLPDYNPNGTPQNALTKIEGEHLNAVRLRTLRDEALSMSLFSSMRFFLITGIEELSASGCHDLLEIVKQAPVKSCFVLCAKKLPSNSAFLKHFQQKQRAIEIGELKNFELQRWVQKELKNSGLEGFNEEVVHSIIQSCESDPDQIAALIEKLALYLEDSKVTIADLAELSKQAADTNEFTLIEMLGKKQTWRHEVLINQILLSGKSPFALLALLARNYSNYLKMAALRESGMQPAQIRQSLGLAPWLFNKQYEISQRYNSRRLAGCMEAILKADATLKNRSLGAEAILSELSRQLAV